jgi:predicted RND superfamily exporter protein
VTGEIERTRAWRFFWAVTAYPRTVVGLCLLTIIGALSVLPWLTKDTRAEAFIQDDHPALVYREKVQEIFGLADPIVVAIVKKGPEGVFNPATLGLLRHLSDEIADLPGVNSERVTSLATEDDIIGTEDGMLVQPFFEEPPETQAEADAIRKSVLGFELYVDSLVARDGGATLIIAELEEEEAGEQVYWDVLALIEAAPHNGEEIYVAGEGAVVARMGAYIDSDAARLNPISAVVITLILFIAYRTLRGVILPNLIVLGTVASALGAMVLAGVPIYVITNGLPPLLIAIAVADGIHILSRGAGTRAGGERDGPHVAPRHRDLAHRHRGLHGHRCRVGHAPHAGLRHLRVRWRVRGACPLAPLDPRRAHARSPEAERRVPSVGRSQ